jgi:hypothetical protein
MEVTAKHVKLGTPYGGICPLCKQFTGALDQQKAETSLYSYMYLGRPRYLSVHPGCVGGTVKWGPKGPTYQTQPREDIQYQVFQPVRSKDESGS